MNSWLTVLPVWVFFLTHFVVSNLEVIGNSEWLQHFPYKWFIHQLSDRQEKKIYLCKNTHIFLLAAVHGQAASTSSRASILQNPCIGINNLMKVQNEHYYTSILKMHGQCCLIIHLIVIKFQDKLCIFFLYSVIVTVSIHNDVHPVFTMVQFKTLG